MDNNAHINIVDEEEAPEPNNIIQILDQIQSPFRGHAQKPMIQFNQIGQKYNNNSVAPTSINFDIQSNIDDIVNEKSPEKMINYSKVVSYEPPHIVSHKRVKSDATPDLVTKKKAVIPKLPLSSMLSSPMQVSQNVTPRRITEIKSISQIESTTSVIDTKQKHQQLLNQYSNQIIASQASLFAQQKSLQTLHRLQSDGDLLQTEVSKNLVTIDNDFIAALDYLSPETAQNLIGKPEISPQVQAKNLAVRPNIKYGVFSGGALEQMKVKKQKYLKMKSKYLGDHDGKAAATGPTSPTFGSSPVKIIKLPSKKLLVKPDNAQKSSPIKSVQSRHTTPVLTQKIRQEVQPRVNSVQNKKRDGKAVQQIESKQMNQANSTSAVQEVNDIALSIRKAFAGFSLSTPSFHFSTVIDWYRIGKVLGKGAFGKVNLAMHKLARKFVAVKSINKQYLSLQQQQPLHVEGDIPTKRVMQEVQILKRIRHPNIVRLYEYFETPKHILFVMELCAGGDLLNYVRKRRRLKEEVARSIFRQLLQALNYCHSRGILHRDIKLDNILLDAESGEVKLCDFGVSKALHRDGRSASGWEGNLTEQCGTPAYIAPEVLEGRGCDGFKADIWSAGVVLYAMLIGTVPFKAGNMSELQKLILKAKFTIKEEPSEQLHKPLSEDSKELITMILERDPARRLSIEQILLHPWMEKGGQNEQIELFSEAEKLCITHEFNYNEVERLNRNEGDLLKSRDLGLFPEHMLDSTQNSLVKNCTSKSVILAPFNSTKSHIDATLSDSIKEMMQSRHCIKLAGRVRDIDRQYELNNNADLDNGVYHKADQSPEESPKKEASTFGKRKKDVIVLTPPVPVQKQTDLERLESLIHLQEISQDSQNTIVQRVRTPACGLQTEDTIVMDDTVVNEATHRFAFPREYLVRCLNNNELNYATTTYWLMVNSQAMGL